MIIAVCVDDRLGMCFNGRRLSRDSTVYAELSATAGTTAIYMDSRSEGLFSGLDARLIACSDFAEKAGEGEYCFMEFISPALYEAGAEKIIIYRWNRSYPSDMKFDIDLQNWKNVESCSFPGSSHDEITKEVYTRE